MPLFTPEQLAQWTGGRWTVAPELRLTAFQFDTRKLRAGEVFIAIKSDKRDGHDRTFSPVSRSKPDAVPQGT